MTSTDEPTNEEMGAALRDLADAASIPPKMIVDSLAEASKARRAMPFQADVNTALRGGGVREGSAIGGRRFRDPYEEADFTAARMAEEEAAEDEADAVKALADALRCASESIAGVALFVTKKAEARANNITARLLREGAIEAARQKIDRDTVREDEADKRTVADEERRAAAPIDDGDEGDDEMTPHTQAIHSSPSASSDPWPDETDDAAPKASPPPAPSKEREPDTYAVATGTEIHRAEFTAEEYEEAGRICRIAGFAGDYFSQREKLVIYQTFEQIARIMEATAAAGVFGRHVFGRQEFAGGSHAHRRLEGAEAGSTTHGSAHSGMYMPNLMDAATIGEMSVVDDEPDGETADAETGS